MTTAPVPALKDRWLRAVIYGFLAEVATIVTIIGVVMANRYSIATEQTDAEYTAFGERVGAVVGIAGGTLYTFLFARALMRRLSTRFIAHGVVVALAAIALSVAGSIAGHQGVPAGYVIASLLKLAAGVLAGFLGASRVPQPAT